MRRFGPRLASATLAVLLGGILRGALDVLGRLLRVLLDLLGRVIAHPGELEVGIVTAFLGAPVFLVVLFVFFENFARLLPANV